MPSAGPRRIVTAHEVKVIARPLSIGQRVLDLADKRFSVFGAYLD